MVYSYFPGCTLKNKARDLDLYGRRAAQALGVTLEEIPEWQCCGGVYPMNEDEIAVRLSSVRALNYAKENGGTLVTICSACHNVIKQVNNDMAADGTISTHANNYLKQDGIEYHGEAREIHYLELLRDEIGYDKVRAAVKNPLKGRKIGAYYGCLLLRPSNVMKMDDAEHPTIMEDLIEAMGAEKVVYAMRNECCGGYQTLEDKEVPAKRARMILENAKDNGADTVITACPLCYYNLKKQAEAEGVRVVYFTELLAQALGVKDENESAAAGDGDGAPACKCTMAAKEETK